MRFLAISVLLAILSSPAFAASEAVKAALSYQMAIDQQDQKKLKSSVTEGYFNTLANNDLMKRLFKFRGAKSRPENYKVKVIESKVVKGSIMASIEPKHSVKKGAHKDHKHKIWVRLEKVNGKYLVSGESHLD